MFLSTRPTGQVVAHRPYFLFTCFSATPCCLCRLRCRSRSYAYVPTRDLAVPCLEISSSRCYMPYIMQRQFVPPNTAALAWPPVVFPNLVVSIQAWHATTVNLHCGSSKRNPPTLLPFLFRPVNLRFFYTSSTSF